MTVLRVGGGVSGAAMMHYMETGEKVGRTLTRDQLDERIILDGNLEEVAQRIDNMHTTTPDAERFLHISAGMKETYLEPEKYAAISGEIKEFLLGGYKPGEMSFYSEAHNPKIKTEPDAKGDPKERFGHIHGFIPKVNNLTGEKEDPLGMMSARFGGKYTTEEYLNAFQESIDCKFGLSNPKDEANRRYDFVSKADILERIVDKKTGKVHDFTGNNREWQQTIRDRMIEEKIETPQAFRAMLEKIGDVSVGLKGTPGEYLKVKPFVGGNGKNVRLDNHQFKNDFITKPTAEKEALIHQEHLKRYIEAQPARLAPEKVTEILSGWELHRDAIRFIHTDSRLYKEKYKDAPDAEKRAILDQLKADHYAGVKSKFEYDDKQLPLQPELDNQAKQEADYQAALMAAFPSRRLNASHLRDLEQIRTAIENGDAIIAEPMTAIDALTFSQSVITARDLERHLLKNTADAQQYNDAMAAVLALPGLVVRQDEKGNTTFTTEDVARIEKSLVDTVERLSGRGKEQTREEIDAQIAKEAEAAPVVPHKQGNQTSFKQDDADHTSPLEAPSVHNLPTIHETEDDQIAREIAATKSMNDGQDAAYKLLVSNKQIAVINGAPGTGKSYILSAMREAEERKGNTVYGAILQGKTAEDLQRDSGINTQTMHSFLFKLNNGSLKLNKKSVVIVDEAGMIGSRQMENLLRHIEKSGAKLRLAGDAKQLNAVEYGRAFKEVSSRCEVKSLTQIMRQEKPWQRAASEQLSRHEIAAPLNAYNEHGNVHFAENEAAAHALVVQKWNALRTNKPAGSRVVLVGTNRERKQLNNLMRAEIKKEGGLQNEVDVVTGDGVRQMAVGEKVMFTAGDKKLGVKNGTTGTIDKIDKDGNISITTDDGKKVAIQASGKGTENGNMIDHFYATTIHKSQGMTIDNVLALPNQNMALENSLVAFTRHKKTLEIVCNKQQFENIDTLTKGLDHKGRKDFSHDEAKPEWSSTRENDNVVSQYKADFAHEKVIEHAVKSAKHVEIRDNLDARELLDRVAISHGVDKTIYAITKDKEGHDRIQCGSRQLNVSDFLTKELHLNYKTEASPILKEAYTAQLEGTYARRRAEGNPIATPAAMHQADKPIWKEFQAHLANRADEYKTKSTDMTKEAKDRRDEIGKETVPAKSRIERSRDSYAAKRTAKKELRARAAEAVKALGKEISDRRGELMAEYKKPQAIEYKDFLAARAQGSEKHMAELRRVSLTDADHARIKSIEDARAIEAHAITPKPSQAAPAVAVVPAVAPSIAVTAAPAAKPLPAELPAAPAPAPAKTEAERLAADLAKVREETLAGATGRNKDKPILTAKESGKEHYNGNVVSSTDTHFVTEERTEFVVHKIVTPDADIKSTGKTQGKKSIAVGCSAAVRYKPAKDGSITQSIQMTERRPEHMPDPTLEREKSRKIRR